MLLAQAALPALAQFTGPGGAGLTQKTFASSPTATLGVVYLFTDASSAGVCTGGGTSNAICRGTGSGWAVTSSSGSGCTSSGSGVQKGNGSGGCAAAVADTDFSAIPATYTNASYTGAAINLTTACGSSAPCTDAILTLTGAVSSAPTITFGPAGKEYNFHILQDSTGTRHWTAANAPANVVGWPADVSLVASSWIDIGCYYDGTNCYVVRVQPSATAFQNCPYQTAPASNPPANTVSVWCDTTELRPMSRNAAGTLFGHVEDFTAVSHEWINSIVNGVPNGSQPACTDVSNGLCNNAANSATAAMTLDMSAATGANAMKVPAQASATCSAAGCQDEDTTATMYHNYTGGADSLVLTNTAAASVTNGDCAQFSKSGSVVRIVDAGGACTTGGGGGTVSSATNGQWAYYTATGTTVGGAGPGTAKQIAQSNGTSGPQFIDFPDAKIIPAANCNAGTAGAGWSTATSNFTAACRAGSNNLTGALQAIPSTGASAQFEFELPEDWDTANQPYIRIFYGSGANTSGTVIWTVSSACTKEDGSVTDDPAFNAESAFASQTMATANREWGQSGQFTAMTSGNNCIAGSNVLIKVAVSGTAGSNINAYKAVVTVPRLLTVQAN